MAVTDCLHLIKKEQDTATSVSVVPALRNLARCPVVHQSDSVSVPRSYESRHNPAI